MRSEPINWFGFRQYRGGPHLATTIMLKELKLLFAFKEGRPLLALFLAIARDSVLRSSVPFIQSFTIKQRVTRETLEEFIDNLEIGRFSPATLKSTAQNINSSWTQSGHLLLVAVYGDAWSNDRQAQLLKSAGHAGKTLGTWFALP